MTDINVDPWIDRIEAEVKDAQGLRAVQGIADLALIIGEERTASPVTPGVYVIPYAEESTAANDLATGGTHQPIRATVGVMSSVQNVRDRTGRQAHQDMRALRRALKDALIGWQPDAESDPVEYAQGRLHKFDDGIILWLDLFRTHYHEYHT